MTRKMKQAAILGMLMLAISASAKRKPEPEPASVEINAAPEAVKPVLLKGLLSHGFALENETEHQITVTRPMPAAMTILTQLLLTPSACQRESTPKLVYTINVVGIAGGTFVNVTAATEHAGTFCRVVREPLDGGKLRTALGNSLQELKMACEKMGPTPAVAKAAVAPATPDVVPPPTPAAQPEPVVLAVPQPESLGDAARRVRAAKETK